MSRMKDAFLGGDFAHARNTDPGTSHSAAAKVSVRLTDIQRAVLTLFELRIEMTDADICEYFKGPESTHRKRRTELVAMGFIRNSGRKRVQNGSNRIIWELVSL